MIQKCLALGIAVALAISTGQAVADNEHRPVIQGGGTSIVTGGGPGLAPVITRFGFNWRDGEGKFECLALIPTAPAGATGSGSFDKNIMYVTGNVLSADIRGPVATLRGLATVTGLGAGTNLPFAATVEPGGPGARMILVVSGLTFDEIVNEGAISF